MRHPQDSVRGMELLGAPALNKGTAFTNEERTQLDLHGLLPPYVETLDEQVVRAYQAYRRKADDLDRHIYLRALQDTNEVLFYRLLPDHIEEMAPSFTRRWWPRGAGNSVRSTGGHAVCSFRIHYAMRFQPSCATA